MSTMNDRLKATTLIKAKEVNVEEAIAESHPRTGPGRMTFTHQKLAKVEAELEIIKGGKVKIADLHEAPGRKRTLTSEAFEELKANLSENPLIHPLTVKVREGGGFEVISGHNRLEVYRQLGRQEIEANVIEVGSDLVEEYALYSNLINSSLSDYEKFAKLNEIQTANQYSRADLIRRSGLSEKVLSKIFKIGKMPKRALAALKKNPNVLGYNAIQKLLDIIEGDGDLVSEAVEKLVIGELKTAKEAVLYATPKPIKVPPIIFRSGKKILAEMRVKVGLVAITIKDKDREAEIVNHLEVFLHGISDESL